MSNISNCLEKMQELTQKNLEILEAINNLFYTKQNHISVDVSGSQYTLPSFLALENKINSLTANFENLVKSPENGEAFFSFDGNSRAIEVRSYTSTPNALTLNTVGEFEVETNDIFKDFLTPIPYIKFNLSELPNDITSVVVKKIIPISNEFKSYMESMLGGSNMSYTSLPLAYSDIAKVISVYKEDVDYTEYDTVMKLPIRKNVGSGTYVIKSIIEDIVDEDLDNYITFSIRTDVGEPYMNDLKYRLFDETIERKLQVGDQLVTFEGNAKLEIMELSSNFKTIKVKVLHGEFVNLVESGESTNISSLSKIKFYSPVDFNEDKYIRVPLEEDRYVFIAVAALNDRMNVQSSWGTGIVVDTYSLTNGKEDFYTYYKNNVKNIGDVLFEMTSTMSNPLSKYGKDEFNKIIDAKPVVDLGNIIVEQINDHLNQSATIENIHSLYSQKLDYYAQLDEIQNKIKGLNEMLSSISFDDTTGMRSAYTSQLADLSSKKNEIYTSISKILNEISIEANNSVVPIEDAKHHIRGYFDYKKFIKDNSLDISQDDVIGIDVRYRYKNPNVDQSYSTIITEDFVFSDWVDSPTKLRVKEAFYDNGYKFKIESDNMGEDYPSFNQLDIPITQGEVVEVKLRVVYSMGWPFAKVASNWSDAVEVTFPKELTKDVRVVDIIKENNNDIESNRFTNILKDEGVTTHIDDSIMDQDITYYHKPENISSGFYTQERRIIPLKDKLATMDASITELFDEIRGTSSDSLQIAVKVGESENILFPYQLSTINLASYDSFSSDSGESGSYVKDGDVVTVVANISIYNPSNHIAKLYSMFPGNRNVTLNDLTNHKFPLSDYCVNATKFETSDNGATYDHVVVDGGVHFVYNDSGSEKIKVQTANQFITFRIKDINTGEQYYKDVDPGDTKWGDKRDENKFARDRFVNSSSPEYVKRTNKEQYTTFAYMYPRVRDEYALCMPSNKIGDYIVINPGEEIVIPIIFEYKIADKNYTSISKTMAFDLRTSLYKEPYSYAFKLLAKKTSSVQDKVIESNRKNYTGMYDTSLKYKPVIK